MDALRDCRVLVTGASGFIGNRVVEGLFAEGADVHGLTRARHVLPDDAVRWHAGDLTDAASIVDVIARVKPHRVIHLAGFSHVGRSWDHVSECIQANVQGTVELLNAVRGTECRRVVYVSTSDVYGDVEAPFVEDAPVNPISPYAVSKYAAERFALLERRAHGTPVVVVRPFNAYGPGQPPDRVVPEIISCALRGDELRMTDARQTREFNHVEDIAAGIVAAAIIDGIEGEVINLGCGQDLSIRAVAGLILELMGDPIVAQFGAIAGRPSEVPRMVADTTKARELLGWKPQRQLRDGLSDTIDWYRTQA